MTGPLRSAIRPGEAKFGQAGTRGMFGKPGSKGTYGVHRPSSALGRIAVTRSANSKCVNPRFPWGGGARALLATSPTPYSSTVRCEHSEEASVLAQDMLAKGLQFRHKLRDSIEHQFPHLN